MNVIVVGAGASGLMAAHAALCSGHSVLIIEKNHRPARKVMITGKGRCNITNNCDIQEFIGNVPRNSRFLYSCVSRFSPDDTIAYFESLNIPLKTERGNRVFPVSDKAVDIVDGLAAGCRGCRFLYDSTVTGIISHDGAVNGVKLSDGRAINADAVIIATGGASYPVTGSTGDGYRFAESVGHHVTDIRPSLVSMESSDGFCSELSGLTLKNIGVSFVKGNKLLYSDFGEMLFTHFGVSGPVILSASSNIDEPSGCSLLIDFKPALSFDKLSERLKRDIEANINKNIVNIMPGLVPGALSVHILSQSCVDKSVKCNQLTAEMRDRICSALKGFKVDITGFRPIDEAIVTRGGVDVTQIDPKTMQSKLCRGLYFVGEVLDVDGYTGGFNLQIALSTGYAAGSSL